MRTFVIAVATTAALTAVAVAWIQCPVCKGSGWDKNLKCFSCQGDGKIGQ